MPDSLPALRTSVDRLAALVGPLDDDAVAGSAYPTEWSIADVVSHLGSGAVIWSRMVADALAGQDSPDGFNQSVWATWDAKTPRAKADDGVEADAALMDLLAGVPAEDRDRLHVSMGPMELDWDGLVRMRLSEHLLHEWDVAVALDPTATLADDGTAIVVDNVGMIAGWAGKPVGPAGTLTIATTGPSRTFDLTIDGAVALAPTAVTPGPSPSPSPSLTMPAEVLIRLVYGRLDPAHTPSSVTGDPKHLDQLRQVFTGF